MNRPRRTLLGWLATLPSSFALAAEAPRRVGLIWNSPPDSEVRSASDASRHPDRLLRGRLPTQLPREEPLRYVLHVNARTARELGLSLPDALRIQADRVFD